jgi:hypothetical protein
MEHGMYSFATNLSSYSIKNLKTRSNKKTVKKMAAVFI